MQIPSLEPTIFLGSAQCALQLPVRAGEQPRRERADDSARRESRDRDER